MYGAVLFLATGGALPGVNLIRFSGLLQSDRIWTVLVHLGFFPVGIYPGFSSVRLVRHPFQTFLLFKHESWFCFSCCLAFRCSTLPRLLPVACDGTWCVHKPRTLSQVLTALPPPPHHRGFSSLEETRQHSRLFPGGTCCDVPSMLCFHLWSFCVKSLTPWSWSEAISFLSFQLVQTSRFGPGTSSCCRQTSNLSDSAATCGHNETLNSVNTAVFTALNSFTPSLFLHVGVNQWPWRLRGQGSGAQGSGGRGS